MTKWERNEEHVERYYIDGYDLFGFDKYGYDSDGAHYLDEHHGLGNQIRGVRAHRDILDSILHRLPRYWGGEN